MNSSSFVIIILFALYVSCYSAPVDVRKDITDSTTASTITSTIVTTETTIGITTTTITTTTKAEKVRSCPKGMSWNILLQSCVSNCGTCGQDATTTTPEPPNNDEKILLYIGVSAAGLLFLMILQVYMENFCVKSRELPRIVNLPILIMEQIEVYHIEPVDVDSLSTPDLPDYTPLRETPLIIREQVPHLPSYEDLPPRYKNLDVTESSA